MNISGKRAQLRGFFLNTKRAKANLDRYFFIKCVYDQKYSLSGSRDCKLLGRGGGQVVNRVGSCPRGLEFDSCSLQTFSRVPAVLKSPLCLPTRKKKEKVII